MMKRSTMAVRLSALVLLAMASLIGHAQQDAGETAAKKQDPKAQALLEAAKAKLRSVDSLVADADITINPSPSAPTRFFNRNRQVSLQRPNRFRVVEVGWSLKEDEPLLHAVSDGKTVTRFDKRNHIAYKKPVRRQHFFLGHNFLVQFFFDPEGLRFDPTAATWGRPFSVFENNVEAYDKDVDLKYLGERTMQGKRYDVVEIKYNTLTNDIRQQVYIADDKLVYQVDTYFDGDVFSEKFRNFRLKPSLPADTWRADTAIPDKIPLVDSDPARMGEKAPEFNLQDHHGVEHNFKELLKGSKGMFVSTVDGEKGKSLGPDAVLPQMRMIQEMKDKFEKQGLKVVAIVGGPGIVPEVKEEMLLNWLPDLSRFNYPVLIDIDLERGLQGSAYENYQLKGRGTLLLDADGKVVFASKGGSEGIDKLALYQALAQIGFAVSPADLEERGRFR